MWDIHSIGDAAFLEAILNALAMIAGTGNLEKVTAIGMLIGLIMLGFQSITEGGSGIRFQNLLVAWIIYAAMFGASARVTIEDAYTGQVRVVDNVPYGVAAAGGMVSQLGYGITSLFEQAFGDVRMTDYGFAFALETLANVRKMTMSQSNLGSANGEGADDFWASWRNYVADCTMTGVDLGEYTLPQIESSARFPGAGIVEQLRFDSQAYGTKLVLSGISQPYQTCTDAFQILSDKTKHDFEPALIKHAASVFQGDPYEARNKIDSALHLINQSQIDAQNYMLVTALKPIFEWGRLDNEINFQRVQSASMLHSSIQQRNEAWAAEQALFNTTVRPMLTFFEGMIYAIAPMIAFLIGLGPMGINLAGKYLLILIWIQLWMPMLSIINLYLHMSVSKSMIALQDPMRGNLPLDSFYGIHAMDQELQNWISTGGMLAASVPAITLMLIYGGAVTASSVASRMSSGNVSTDAVTPSLTKNSPILERSPLVQSSEATGMRGPDSEKLNLNIGAGYTTALGSSKDEVNQKQAAFSSQLGQQLVQAYGSEEKAMQAVTAGITNTSSQSDAYRAAVAHGEDLIRGSSLSEQLKDEQKAMIGSGAALGASVGFKMLGNGATVSSSLTAQLAKEAGLTGTQSQELGEIIKLNAANSQESAAGFMTAVAKDSMDTGSDTFTKNVGLTDSDVLSRSAAELLSTSARFTASNQMQQAMGIVSNHSSETLPSQLRQHGLDDDVRGFMARYGSQGGENSLHKLANGYYNTIMANNPRGNADDAKLAAQTFAIADGRFLEGADEGLREQMALEGAQIFSRLSGLSSPDQTGYRANEGIGSEAARIVGGTRDRVESSVTGPDSSPAAVRDTVNSGIVGVRSRIDNTDVEADFQERRGAVEDTVSDNSNILSGHRGEILRERLTKTAESNASILDTVGLAHVPIGNVTAQTLRDHGIGHLAMGADNYAALRKNAGLTAGMKRDDFMNMPEQERSQEITSVHGKLSSSLQEMGLNKDIADYSAAMMMPQVIDNLYSNSGATLGMFGGSEHTRDDVISAANEASAGLRAEMHDKLQSGLLVATGDSQLADMAMQQIANAATVVTHSPTSEGAAIANQMVNNTMAAANFGGEGPGTGGGAAWYGSPKPSAPTVVNSEPSQTPPPKSNINNPLIQ